MPFHIPEAPKPSHVPASSSSNTICRYNCNLTSSSSLALPPTRSFHCSIGGKADRRLKVLTVHDSTFPQPQHLFRSSITRQNYNHKHLHSLKLRPDRQQRDTHGLTPSNTSKLTHLSPSFHPLCHSDDTRRLSLRQFKTISHFHTGSTTHSSTCKCSIPSQGSIRRLSLRTQWERDRRLFACTFD